MEDKDSICILTFWDILILGVSILMMYANISNIYLINYTDLFIRFFVIFLIILPPLFILVQFIDIKIVHSYLLRYSRGLFLVTIVFPFSLLITSIKHNFASIFNNNVLLFNWLLSYYNSLVIIYILLFLYTANKIANISNMRITISNITSKKILVIYLFLITLIPLTTKIVMKNNFFINLY